MKLSEVEVGGRYMAKVSGRTCVVRVVELTEVQPTRTSRLARKHTVISAVNEATGRKLTIRSAQRLRCRAGGDR